MLQIQRIANLVAGAQNGVNVLLRVRSTDAEAHTRGHQGRGRIRDDDDNDRRLARKHHLGEDRHLAGVEDQEGDNRRVVTAICDEPELSQPK